MRRGASRRDTASRGMTMCKEVKSQGWSEAFTYPFALSKRTITGLLSRLLLRMASHAIRLLQQDG